MNKICFEPIGIIYSPFKKTKGTPIQPAAGKSIEGRIEIYQEFADGLKDIEGFSHIILLFHLHLARKAKLLAKPYMNNEERGIFAIRGPSRPNPIGLSVVELTKRERNILYIKNLDIVDGTPLLDIKPYVPEFDHRDKIKIGWLEKRIHKLPITKDDGRFRKD